MAIRRLLRPALAVSSAAALAALAACADRQAPTAPAEAIGARRDAARGDAAAIATTLPIPAASAQVVMSGLNNPRGIAFDPAGALYVAEAGTLTYDDAVCAPIPRGRNCYSGTGSVSRLWRGVQERVLTGLPSVVALERPNPSAPVTLSPTGPQHIDFQGRGNGYLTIGWGGGPAARAALGALRAGFGTLARFTPDGRWSVVADLAAFEQANDPDGAGADSNPYGVLAEAGRTYVADAGGNTLLEVRANGATSLVAVIPGNTPANVQSVPTKVRRAPDGSLLVGTLSAVPFAPTTAAIWRVVPGAPPARLVSGLTQVVDFVVAGDGTLYVLQHASAVFFNGPGSVQRVLPNGTLQPVVTQLSRPTGLAIGPDGALYIANRSVARTAGQGEVLRVVL